MSNIVMTECKQPTNKLGPPVGAGESEKQGGLVGILRSHPTDPHF